MILHKLFALSLIFWLLFQPAVTPTPKLATETKADEISPEMKKKALELLDSISRETQQFGLPENRVQTQIIVAGMLWEHDERGARKIFQNALAELQSLFGGLAAVSEEENSAAQSELYTKKYSLSELRRQYVLALAPHDPKTALAALQSLKIETTEEYDPLSVEGLELQIASAIVKKDPSQAYELAKRQLKEGVSYNLLESLKDLHKKDSETAAKLAKDILARVKTAEIRPPSNANMSGNVTLSNSGGLDSSISTTRLALDIWQVVSFLTTAAELNRQAARSKDKSVVALLSEPDMRELAEMIARAFLAGKDTTPYMIGSAMAEITRLSPARAAQIRRKVGAEGSQQIDHMIESNSYSEQNDMTLDERVAAAEKAPADQRDARLSDAVYKALADENPEKAQEIAAKIKDKKTFQYLFESIDAALPLAKAKKGDLEEVRKMLATMSSTDERIAALAELATALAIKGESEASKKLLEEASSMLPGRLKKQTQLESTVKVVAGYALASPEQSFVMLENSIAQMNDFINAAIMLDEFYDQGATSNDELLYNSINRQGLLHVPGAVDLMKNLAKADFERTVNLADKFSRPEIRILVRIKLAQSLLDPEAAERDKKDLETMQSEHAH